MRFKAGFHFFCLSLLILGLTSCASRGKRLEDVSIPLIRIKKIVEASMPNGTRYVSANGRRFVSHYYDPYDPLKEEFESARKRSYAQVTILGDRRPYTLEVVVFNERRRRSDIGMAYEKVGFDAQAEEALALRIKLRLSKASGSRDFIDDFRPF